MFFVFFAFLVLVASFFIVAFWFFGINIFPHCYASRAPSISTMS